jgi:hypothetical protein
MHTYIHIFMRSTRKSITLGNILEYIFLEPIKSNSRKRARRGWGQGGEMTQALYAHMNNKTIKKKKEGQLEVPLRMTSCNFL